MTTFVFRVRNVPAALYKALGGFATNGVNMTKLESYQLGGRFITTQFYADIEDTRKSVRCSLHWKNCASSPRKCEFWAFTREVDIASTQLLAAE